MKQSFSDLIDTVLNEARAAKLVKLAERGIVKEATVGADRVSRLAQRLQKLSWALRRQRSADVTLDDIRNFIGQGR